MYLFDALFLLIFSFAFTQGHGFIKASTFSPNLYPPYVFLILLYFLVSVLKYKHPKYQTIADTAKIILFCLIFTITIGKSFYTAVNLRHKVPNYPIHDNPLQLEAAVSYLKDGKNPYVETFHGTPQQDWYQEKENPALYHMVTLPFYLLSSLAVSYPSEFLIGYFDERLVHLILFLLVLYLIFTIVKEVNKKIIFLSLFAFNPLLIYFFVEGRNDIFVFSLIFLAIYFLSYQKISIASLFLGLALASKQSSWLFAPIFLLYIFVTEKGDFIDRFKHTIWKTLPMFLAFFTLVLPFLIWDFQNFIEDTILYPAGSLKTSFPMAGLGFSYFLVKSGLVKDGRAYFPFSIIQGLVSLPWLVYVYFQFKKDKTMHFLIVAYMIFLFIFWYFSRFIMDNYVGFLSMLGIASVIFYDSEQNLTANKDKLISKKTRIKSGHYI